MRPHTLCTPLRANWQVAGHLTNTLWWPAREETTTVLLFIPGNPGLIEYYAEFLECIHAQASPNLEIFAVSHLGVSTGDDPNALYSFQDQIDHKIECFDILKKRYSADDTKFVLMGHSIGAYLAVEVFKQRHAFNIDRLIALFPCLYDIALTPNGMHFTRIFNKLPIGVVSTMASALSYISPPLLERLIRLLTGQQGHSVKVTASLLNGFFVRSVLRMAQQEMENVQQLDHDFYTTHLDKFIIYYSENDQWAPIEHYKYMKQSYPQHEHLYLCEERLPHSFILDPGATQSMANKVVHWLDGSNNSNNKE
ncbi:upf0554 protein c2orf43 homolog [Lichtheimia corymbifera JMRC:FSU:9682]|uniref:Upf0554 protein c2orf43 homolog n=1 Tax=Lichtheimia corymbifera JMRC:FSU:9682 TaxID=1263082 RepID=A0A068RVZ3_9FUNG|nr:upf0554 protein c2orf43 homolog [Lichtheimia corymbifera JMRC:FSU:9682]